MTTMGGRSNREAASRNWKAGPERPYRVFADKVLICVCSRRQLNKTLLKDETVVERNAVFCSWPAKKEIFDGISFCDRRTSETSLPGKCLLARAEMKGKYILKRIVCLGSSRQRIACSKSTWNNNFLQETLSGKSYFLWEPSAKGFLLRTISKAL